jgi:hypothetical protein
VKWGQFDFSSARFACEILTICLKLRPCSRRFAARRRVHAQMPEPYAAITKDQAVSTAIRPCSRSGTSRPTRAP